jgi:hypothetical protein
MEHTKKRIKKQRREEPGRVIEVAGHKDSWNGELLKYYCYRETAISPNELKQFEQLLRIEKRVEEERR